jgi:hypothetical protein
MEVLYVYVYVYSSGTDKEHHRGDRGTGMVEDTYSALTTFLAT